MFLGRTNDSFALVHEMLCNLKIYMSLFDKFKKPVLRPQRFNSSEGSPSLVTCSRYIHVFLFVIWCRLLNLLIITLSMILACGWGDINHVLNKYCVISILRLINQDFWKKKYFVAYIARMNKERGHCRLTPKADILPWMSLLLVYFFLTFFPDEFSLFTRVCLHVCPSVYQNRQWQLCLI